MQRLIAKIGKGQKASKDLTWEEAKRAIRLLIEGQATPTQTGAFLLAMRFKMESVAELAACTSAARDYVSPLPVSEGLPLVDFPTYAGKRDTFHASVGSAIVAAATGASVLMHGYDGVPDRPGPAGVLSQLGIPTELDPKEATHRLETAGFAYLDLTLYHPPVARFLDLRGELGVRNVFHAVAKMLNPARASSQVIGVSHPPYLEKTAEALKMLGAPRAFVVRGVEGDPELSLTSATRVLELRDERVIPLSLQPKDVGMAFRASKDAAGFPRDQIAKEALLIRRILCNEIHGGARDWVVLNAAMLLYAAGKAASISAAVPEAIQAIQSGAVARKLQEVATAAKAVGGSTDQRLRPDGSSVKSDRAPSDALIR